RRADRSGRWSWTRTSPIIPIRAALRPATLTRGRGDRSYFWGRVEGRSGGHTNIFMPKKSPLFASFADRSAVLRQSRDLKMAGSAHAAVRGTTLKCSEWLTKADIQKVQNGPPVWIWCSEASCHSSG